MQNYSIMPLDLENIDEICEDILEQHKNKVANCFLFKMTLVPEGNPPIKKAEMLCEVYDAFKEKLEPLGIKIGMLMQASIGHGWVLDHMFPFTQYTGMTNGYKDYICCPYDKGFQDYIRNATRIMANHKPSVIMVDDDFRLINVRNGKGCACELHLAEFNKRAGTDFTREQLAEHITSGKDEDKKYVDIYISIEEDSLIQSAKAMREGIDSVDPTIPGVFCCVGNACEAAAEIATILAGKGNPVTVRINNGNYTPAGARFASVSFMRAAIQKEILTHSGKIDAILAETDTCPQNRYSTSAQSLHTHFTGTILEGAAGAKHWITRLAAHEPNSGKAYRKILSKNSGFYQTLSELTPTLKWLGCRIPVSYIPDYNLDDAPMEMNNWCSCVLERFGLPMYFSSENGGAVFLDGKWDSYFSDEEILEMFKGTVVLDGIAAERLKNRGFLKYIGVDATVYDGKERTSGEIIAANGKFVKAQLKPRRLTPIPEAEGNIKELSFVYNLLDGKTKKPLFSGCTMYKNSLGGTTIVFCGAAKSNFNIIEAFPFLTESRKLQFIEMLKECGNLPIYYPDDAEVYLKAAEMSDGGMFCAFFNIGLDPIEKITLVSEKAVKRIEILTPEGNRRECDFTISDGTLIIDEPAYTLNPVILFLYEN